VCGERWASLSKSYIVLLVDLADVRRLVIIAMFSDDVLFGKLVLKGGNAISLVYTYGAKVRSMWDFSTEGEFEDTADAARRITRALTDRFDAAGFIVFDCTFGPRPLTPSVDNPRWGGYRIQFKIIERDKHRRFNGELDAIRPQRNNDRPVATTGVHYRHKQVGVLQRKDGTQTEGIHDLRLHSLESRG
jgi:hypothetical protein